MTEGATVLSATALLFGLGAGLLAYGLLSEQRRRATARRVATFVGPQVESRSRLALSWPAPLRQLPDPCSVTPAGTSDRAQSLSACQHDDRADFRRGDGFFGRGNRWTGAFGFREPDGVAGTHRATGASRDSAHGLGAAGGISAFPRRSHWSQKRARNSTASEFSRSVQEVELGSSLDEALARMAERTTRDYGLVSDDCLLVLHEVGGNLCIWRPWSETLYERSDSASTRPR